MKTLPLMLVLGLTSAVYANEDSNTNELMILGLVDAMAVSGTVLSHSEVKNNQLNAAKARLGKEGTFILAPQIDTKGKVLLDKVQYNTDAKINKVMKQVFSYEFVTITYIKSPQISYANYIDEMEDQLTKYESDLKDLNDRIKYIEGPNRGTEPFPGNYIRKSLEDYKAQRHDLYDTIAHHRNELNDIKSMSPVNFVKEYQEKIIITERIETGNNRAERKLASILNGKSQTNNRLISIQGHRTPLQYEQSARNARYARGAVGTFAGVTLAATAYEAAEVYSDFFDGRESTKDDFTNSSSKNQTGSSVDKK